MAKQTEVREGSTFKAPDGRIGRAYAVTQRKIDMGHVDLFFDGPGCVFVGENYAPPSGCFKIEALELVKY